ncbi:MAG: hypothetical protein ABMA01_20665, partial [Chthoniobacteraceae bacterium]
MNWLRMSNRRGWRRGIPGLLAVVFAIAVSVSHAAPKRAPKKPAPKPEAKPAAGQKPPAAEDLFEGPAAAKAARPAAAKPVAEGVVEAPLSAGPKYADAWPSERRKPERDLELTREAEGRAEAIAAFVEGEVADGMGDPDRALEAWKRATALDPSNAGLAVKVAVQLAKRNEPAEAIRG